MIYDEIKTHVIEFLKEHATPEVKTSATLRDGFAICIKPIRGICGAEIICGAKTRPDIVSLIRGLE